MLCAYKKDWKSFKPVIESLRVEPEYLQEIPFSQLDQLKQNYQNYRAQKFINGIEKELKK